MTSIVIKTRGQTEKMRQRSRSHEVGKWKFQAEMWMRLKTVFAVRRAEESMMKWSMVLRFVS
jgi:hypothetical protein